MLNKNDLAKQFELVTKQEIKNYQDSLNFILQSINELKETIAQVQKKSLENHAMLHGKQENILVEINTLKSVLINENLRYERDLKNQKVINEKNENNYKLLIYKTDSIYSVNNSLNNYFNNLMDQVLDIRVIACSTKHRLEESMNDIFVKFSKMLEKTKNDILNAPTETSVVRKDLEEKIESHKVDVAGIMRELTIYKKENLVTEKKIENIYTLIERLQKSQKDEK